LEKRSAFISVNPSKTNQTESYIKPLKTQNSQSKQLFISLYGINLMDFISEAECVYCAVRTE